MIDEIDYTITPETVPLAELPDIPTAEFTVISNDDLFTSQEEIPLEDLLKPRRSENLAAELTFLLSNMFLEINVVVC